MVWFWLFAALLVIAVVVLLLRPLLRRRSGADVSRNALNAALYADQMSELEADLRSGAIAADAYENARRELKARLLADAGEPEAPQVRHGGRGAAIALGLAVPIAAAGIYFLIGTPAAIAPQVRTAPDAAHNLEAQQIEAMIGRLAEKMRREPGNLDGWVLLGRSYGMFGRFAEAADAYSQAVKLRPGDAQLLADYADVLGMASGRSLIGEPEKLIARALEIDPKNLKALALAGTIAFEKKEFKSAAALWERMLPLVGPDSEEARSIRANVDEARALAGEPVARAPESGVRAAAPKGELRGSVRLATELAAKTAPGDTVFIFARAVDGPQVPLAVLRKQVRDLPATFALDDSMAMAPGMNLSSFPRVIVGARISKSPGVAAQSGDLQGLSAPVASNASDVAIVIDSVVR